MKNAHLRFGWLSFYKRTEKTTTHIKLRLDRFVAEIDPEPPRRAHAHLISVIGSDTQIAAVNAAISMDEDFTVEGPGIPSVHASLGRKAVTYKGSVQLSDRKKPLRHLIGISQDFMNICTATNTSRTLVIDSSPAFLWSAVARLQGLPAIPEWADWFCRQLEQHKAVTPVVGIGCEPVLIRGSKEQFLKWLSRGIERGAIQFPVHSGRIHWPAFTLKQVFHPFLG
jgi:hypothetical protein